MGITKYLVDEEWIVKSHDAKKTGNDNNMCWAAAASNILTWTRWSSFIPREPGQSAQAIFETFKEEVKKEDSDLHFLNNHMSTPNKVWEWWFDKYYNPSDIGNHYYHDPNFFGYRHEALERIRDYFQEKNSGVVIQTTRMGNSDDPTGNSHYVTCWGFDFDESLDDDNPEKYSKIYITDSDDTPSIPQLQDYIVTKGNGNNPNYWYLKGFLGKDDYFIADIYALGSKLSDDEVAAPDAPTGLTITT